MRETQSKQEEQRKSSNVANWMDELGKNNACVCFSVLWKEKREIKELEVEGECRILKIIRTDKDQENF